MALLKHAKHDTNDYISQLSVEIGNRTLAITAVRSLEMLIEKEKDITAEFLP